MLSNNHHGINIIDSLHANGATCYIVGGFVRDKLLNIESKDLDIEVYNMSIKQMKELIEQFTPAVVIEKYGIVTTSIDIDFALPRTERKIGVGYGDFEVSIVKNNDLKLSAKRRDFTINSIMYNLKTDQLVDNYHGISDLENKIIRHISPHFIEDSVRVLRGIRFASVLGFKIANQTEQMMLSIADQIKYQPKKRISDELLKIVNGKYYKDIAPFLYKVLQRGYNFEYQRILVTNSPMINLYNILNTNNNLSTKQLSVEGIFINKCLENIDNNLQMMSNYQNLNHIQRVDVLNKTADFKDVYIDINLCLIEEYKLMEVLLKKYNGYYFINQGVEPKLIAQYQLKKVGEVFAKLSNYN